MCRLFAYIAKDAHPLTSHFIETHKSLLKQANKNPDGWGMVYFDSEGERHYEKENLNTHLVIAHIRYATVGKMAPENAHPFIYGKWAFVHNGTVQQFHQVRERVMGMLPEHLRVNIKGRTDSEVLFAFFLGELERQQELHGEHISEKNLVITALRNSITKINSIALYYGAEGDSRINILLTDGKDMWGTRFGKHLHRKRAEDNSRFIATEITDKEGGWKPFPENIVFHIAPGADEIDMRPLLNRKPDFAIPHPSQRAVSS
mgnify:CR=1 FL=1